MTNKYLSFLERQIEIIPNRLYFLAGSKQMKYQNPHIFQFNVDNVIWYDTKDLKYSPFHHDFGPLKISCVYQYVAQLVQIDRDPQNKKKKFVHATSSDPKKYTNSVFLICCYTMIALKKTPDEAYEPFKNFKIIGFRDSSSSNCTFEIQVLDCLRGLYRAMRLGWFSMDKFSIDNYQHYELTQNGDINQIIKDKIYAFSAPSEHDLDRLGKKNLRHKDLAEILKNLGIGYVVHLEQADQFSKVLEKQKIESFSLPFPELTSPETSIVEKFDAFIEKHQKHKIGINCKTGLGKVGTMIACYLIKKYSFSAYEAIAWTRLCRPGSVIGHQQQFLVLYQKKVNSQRKINQIGQSAQKKPKLMRKYSHNHNGQSSTQQEPQKTSEKPRVSKMNSLKDQKDQPEIYSPLIRNKNFKANSKISGFDIDRFLNELRDK